MKIQIKNRWTAEVIFECDAESLRVAVELAVSKKVSLRASNLRGSNLSGSDLRGSNLRDSNLRDSNLSGSNLRGSNLRDSDLSDSDLSDSDLSDSDLSGSDLSGSNLRGSDLSDSNLSDSNLSDSNLSDSNLSDSDLSGIKDDFLKKIELLAPETPGLYKAILDGHIDGSCYEGECACFVGTYANLKGVKPQALADLCGLQMDSSSPVEKWFMGIAKGDTPENNPVAAITAEWIRGWAKEKNVSLPTRKVVWE